MGSGGCDVVSQSVSTRIVLSCIALLEKLKLLHDFNTFNNRLFPCHYMAHAVAFVTIRTAKAG